MAIRYIPLSVAFSLASLALATPCAMAQTSVTMPREGRAGDNQDRLMVRVAVRPKLVSAELPQEKSGVLAETLQQSLAKEQVPASPNTESDPNRGTLTPLAMEGVRTPIRAVNIVPSEIGTRILPEDEAAKLAHPIVPLPGGTERGWGYLDYRWQAANIYHWPLYFEDPMLERHGQYRTPECLQPAVSGAKFLGNVALYPYRAAMWPAFESRYTLGHFRPGSSAPLLRDTLPWSSRAALVQGATATGVFVGLPW